MRIAQVAPLYERVPPRLYGGTERVVRFLTEALVAQGHDVTLFACADSETGARLVPAACSALRLADEAHDRILHHVLLLDDVARRAQELDIVHFHAHYLHFPLVRRLPAAHLTTLHGRLDLPDLEPLYRRFDDVPVVSISDAQRTPLRFALRAPAHAAHRTRPGGMSDAPREPGAARAPRTMNPHLLSDAAGEGMILVGDARYVRADSSRTDDRTRVLEHGETFAVFDRFNASTFQAAVGERGPARAGSRERARGSAGGSHRGIDRTARGRAAEGRLTSLVRTAERVACENGCVAVA